MRSGSAPSLTWLWTTNPEIRRGVRRFRATGILPVPGHAQDGHGTALVAAPPRCTTSPEIRRGARRSRATGIPPVLEHGQDGHGTTLVAAPPPCTTNPEIRRGARGSRATGVPPVPGHGRDGHGTTLIAATPPCDTPKYENCPVRPASTKVQCRYPGAFLEPDKLIFDAPTADGTNRDSSPGLSPFVICVLFEYRPISFYPKTRGATGLVQSYRQPFEYFVLSHL